MTDGFGVDAAPDDPACSSSPSSSSLSPTWWLARRFFFFFLLEPDPPPDPDPGAEAEPLELLLAAAAESDEWRCAAEADPADAPDSVCACCPATRGGGERVSASVTDVGASSRIAIDSGRVAGVTACHWDGAGADEPPM
jgi:hypothetical protein